MKRIPLTQGKFAIVDDEDYAYLMQWKWYAHKSKGTYYAQRHTVCSVTKKHAVLSMHRVIIKCPQHLQADHRNHNGLDNRKQNLRACSHSQNQHNRRVTNCGASKYKGVYWNKGKWQAGISHNDKNMHIIRCASEERAAMAYNAKAIELFGEFACLNVIEEAP